MNKTFFKFFAPLLLVLLLSACEGDDETTGGKLYLSSYGVNLYQWDIVTKVVVAGGDGGYTAVSSNNDVATVTVERDTMFVVGVNNGTATIVVKDSRNNLAKFSITVSGQSAIIPSYYSFAKIDELKEFTLFRGHGGYNIAIDNTNNVSATIEGDKIRVKALRKGKATILVTDKRGTSMDITMSVFNKNELIIGSTSVNVTTTSTVSQAIFSGDGNYVAVSADESIATGEIEVQNASHLIKIRGESVGKTTIRVIDGAGDSIVINVTVL